MIPIYRITDRIPVKIGPIEFSIGPLNHHQRSEVIACVQNESGDVTVNANQMAFLCVKYQVKGIKGIECVDGKDYELEFDSDCLTDNCASEIMGLENKESLLQVLSAWLTKMGSDPKIKGVEIKYPGSKRKNVKSQG